MTYPSTDSIDHLTEGRPEVTSHDGSFEHSLEHYTAVRLMVGQAYSETLEMPYPSADPFDQLVEAQTEVTSHDGSFEHSLEHFAAVRQMVEQAHDETFSEAAETVEALALATAGGR